MVGILKKQVTKYGFAQAGDSGILILGLGFRHGGVKGKIRAKPTLAGRTPERLNRTIPNRAVLVLLEVSRDAILLCT
ncbi:MAG: hypothetical protein CVV64_17115 [Candidatus Wallbacteria bacterium HGW-Wallbacteria-1]|uniref:Uncharacterized protein n=1 Tax=Candidatus Wallbacteria bacterium HGW-Wallbacteria-1 TaxID=2013854 RepID=A0A2N1PKD7_9BACT|nr:MAG: hypothetical protein CVV64_17115 [Candidatus Wallbacteria bacterium HGW-Wallbacteria-1]